MRAPLKAVVFALALALASLPVMAQEGGEEGGTPQGRGPAKAKKAAGAVNAAQPSAAPQDAGQASAPAGTSAVLQEVEQREEASVTGRGLSYDPQGRRDPFISPAEAQEAEFAGDCEGEGFECWLISEVNLVGIMGRRGGAVALVIGPDGYGASLKAGDNLYDGEVLSVSSATGTVVFRQRVNDPTRIKPYRDIEKKMSTKEGGV